MKQFIIRRFGYAMLSLFLLSMTIFFFVRVTGDPAALLVEPGASADDIAAIHHQFGLDRPLVVQYVIFMGQLLQGDLGKSFYYQTPVMQLYLSRLPPTQHLRALKQPKGHRSRAAVGASPAVPALSLRPRSAYIHRQAPR